MTAPLEPWTALVTVAVNLSPGLCVFVQTRAPEVIEIVVPAPMLATRPSLPLGDVETRLPLGVVLGVVVRGVVVRGVVVAGRLTLPPLVDVDGTSVSCGCAVSRFASSRSRFSAAVSPARSSDRKSTRLNSSHSQISYAVF